jgi:osmotically-inducible protein OsmY
MKVKVLALSYLSAVTVALSIAPARAGDREDARLGKRVEEQLLQEERLRDYVLDAKVEDGVVTLTGKVALDAAKKLAGEVAEVPGVARIDNQIEVAPLTFEERQAMQERLARAREKAFGGASANASGQQAAPTGQAAPSGQAAAPSGQPARPGFTDDQGFVHLQLPPSAPILPGDPEKMVSGEVITKSWIQTRILSELEGDEAMKRSNVKVETSDDFVVTLKGSVATEAAHQRALQVARDTKGVRFVEDELKVARRSGAERAPAPDPTPTSEPAPATEPAPAGEEPAPATEPTPATAPPATRPAPTEPAPVTPPSGTAPTP